MIQSMRGFKDILPSEVKIWQDISRIVISLLRDFRYNEIYTPILENKDLFSRSIGNGTDIVEKEMYTFEDRKGRLVTLRPEATASIARAYIQHKMYATEAITRLYTIGPMFRRERPQKGRYRQFHQINVEVFGTKSSYMDVELIFILYTLMIRLSLKKVILHINTLGCLSCRPSFKEYLFKIISKRASNLCNDCIRRKNDNPLRVLDCKVESCRDVISDIKPIYDFLCNNCKNHFNKVLSLLCRLEIPFTVNKYLVRGLDYYTRTTFEIYHEGLGNKIALAGGGRYDELVKLLGGPKVPAIGFAIGLNRLVEVIRLICNTGNEITPDLFIAVLGESAMESAFEWQMKLSKDGIKVLLGNSKNSLKSQMKQANKINSTYVIILGEEELKKNEVIFRCMRTGVQWNILTDNILSKIKDEITKLK